MVDQSFVDLPHYLNAKEMNLRERCFSLLIWIGFPHFPEVLMLCLAFFQICGGNRNKQKLKDRENKRISFYFFSRKEKKI
jgi:hypothetical protein